MSECVCVCVSQQQQGTSKDDWQCLSEAERIDDMLWDRVENCAMFRVGFHPDGSRRNAYASRHCE